MTYPEMTEEIDHTKTSESMCILENIFKYPDLNRNDTNAEDRFKLINEAYAILSDPKKRNEWESRLKSNNKFVFSL